MLISGSRIPLEPPSPFLLPFPSRPNSSETSEPANRSFGFTRLSTETSELLPTRFSSFGFIRAEALSLGFVRAGSGIFVSFPAVLLSHDSRNARLSDRSISRLDVFTSRAGADFRVVSLLPSPDWLREDGVSPRPRD
ncbi:hypothetical protein M8J75_001578 [Diaphorina citri]|nr:hypothetical protein M8J75_001578 [Diaphorina citri]